jgi:hypothetical protein
MLASGHLVHHAEMVSGTVVASLHPFGVRGCFPGLSQLDAPHEQPAGPVGV